MEKNLHSMLGRDSTSTAVAPSLILLFPPDYLDHLPKMLSEPWAMLDLVRYTSQPKVRKCSGQLDNFFGYRLFDFKEGLGGDLG